MMATTTETLATTVADETESVTTEAPFLPIHEIASIEGSGELEARVDLQQMFGKI